MPWFDYKEGTDEDLRAVWAYRVKRSSGEIIDETILENRQILEGMMEKKGKKRKQIIHLENRQQYGQEDF